MNEKETLMAKFFPGGSFPGHAPEQGNAHVIEAGFQPGEAPPVDLTDPSNPEMRPVTPVTELTFDNATGLPIILAEQAFSHTPFEDDDFPVELPELPDFF